MGVASMHSIEGTIELYNYSCCDIIIIFTTVIDHNSSSVDVLFVRKAKV